MMKRNMPGQPFTNYITVKSIEAMNQVVQANGGTVILPKQEIGKGMGWISAFKDPENNVIGLHEMAPAARPMAAAKKSSAKRARGKRAGKKRR
jgi:predicted enzyme related to lactoylglutathione lyase